MGSQNPFTSNLLFLLIGFSAYLAACEPAPNITQIFEDWIERYDRVYSNSEEKARRFEIFKNKIDFQKSNIKEYSYQGCLIIDRPDLRITNNPMLSGHSKSRSLLVQRSDCQSQQVDWSKDRWIEDGQEKKFIPSPVRRVENQYSVCGK